VALFDVFTSGEEGLGADVREELWVFQPSWDFSVVMKNQPADGSGKGTAATDSVRAPYPNSVPIMSMEMKVSTREISNRAHHVHLRVLRVLFEFAMALCFPGPRSKPPRPAVAAASRTRDAFAPPSCIAA
jgi:hypothetical protein